ncbi:FO synthase subunit 1 [Stanieria cyanosphaera PCC 7437]|uniref:7,8-didemethyl-8-hydroxy-5-deazariboflavin synthase n=1 Tax=Stanieria cyanosphaera (strain ATCC 29371 / PCC 7437) TaxID=111780 RepID=K9XTT7_STAC7|nr:7,8-didemethyl-8-hydroxy-5-deazariboflavin synthase subunit CofG [Stanieria cyanosphaera]AFZ35491.1 FO synthase subunit 1 [Stanieria cyanosphaera PCC 7437]
MNKTVTYSPAYTLVPTYQCFNRCSYCNFRTDIGQSDWLSVKKVREQLHQLKLKNVSEILLLSGEVHPLAHNRQFWFERIYRLCLLALELNFLPHTNAGILSWQEMEQLKQVNVSMGLMLEQLTPKLLSTVHKYAPSKVPQLRLQQLEWAGKLKIPFTTGLLLGIGETESDWWDSLKAIADIQQEWGHIQEVILQPHSLGNQQVISTTSFSLERLPEVIARSREILPDSIRIQIPPNLVVEPNLLLKCLDAGARDLGGISPKDEVNPDYPHLTAEYLQSVLETAGWQLVPRLPVYPQYYSWLSPPLQKLVKAKEKALRCNKLINR